MAEAAEVEVEPIAKAQRDIAPETRIERIPLNRLRLAPENVRKMKNGPEAFRELKSSIKSHGLMENLVVREDGTDDFDGEKMFAVVCGGRRLRAMNSLAHNGEIESTFPVPCNIVKIDTSDGELSLAENMVRAAMHPADQVVAFDYLTKKGMSIHDISIRFGVSECVIERRLRVARVAPVLLQAYRNSEIDLATLQAFTVTENQQKQINVYENHKKMPYSMNARMVKDDLTEGDVLGYDARVKFVGREAYEAAGGQVDCDLFAESDDRGIFYKDSALLEKLALEKLETEAEKLRGEWKWADTMIFHNWDTMSKLGRVRPQDGEYTDEENKEIEKLQDDYSTLRSKEDWTSEDIEREEEITYRFQELDNLRTSRNKWLDKDKKNAGCMVMIGHDGELNIEKGLMLPEDIDRLQKEKHGEPAEKAGVDEPITQPIKRQEDEQSAALKDEGMSRVLAEDLRHVRNTLIKANLAQKENYDCAYDLFLFQLCSQVLSNSHRERMALNINFYSTHERPYGKAGDERFAEWSPAEGMLKAIPETLNLYWLDLDDDWEAFRAMCDLREDEKQALFCAAMSQLLKEQLSFDTHARPEKEQVVQWLGIDFANEVKPRGDLYWSRISKPKMLKEAEELFGVDFATEHAKKKKHEIVSAIDKAFEDGLHRKHNPKYDWTLPGFKAFKDKE